MSAQRPPVWPLALHGLAHRDRPPGRPDGHQDAHIDTTVSTCWPDVWGVGRGLKRGGEGKRGGGAGPGLPQAPNQGAGLPQASHFFALVWQCPPAPVWPSRDMLASVWWQPSEGWEDPWPSHLESSERGRSAWEGLLRLIWNQTPQVCEVPPRMTVSLKVCKLPPSLLRWSKIMFTVPS